MGGVPLLPLLCRNSVRSDRWFPSSKLGQPLCREREHEDAERRHQSHAGSWPGYTHDEVQDLVSEAWPNLEGGGDQPDAFGHCISCSGGIVGWTACWSILVREPCPRCGRLNPATGFQGLF